MAVRQRKELRKRNQGLTLVELVVVLTILVALGGLVIPRLMATTEVARETATLASAVEIRDAVLRFWSDCKYAYPSKDLHPDVNANDQRIQLGHLLELPSTFPVFNPNLRLGWNGPYLQSDGRLYSIDDGSGFTSAYGDASQPAVRDTFANQDYDLDGVVESGLPFVIQEPTLSNLGLSSLVHEIGEQREVRVVSAGPNGILEIEESRFASELESNPALKGDDIYVSFTLR